MRGRVAKESLNRFDGGITPTYAGKRLLFPDRGATPWNYPHVRGEEDLTTPRDYARPELPPRTRGRGVRGCAACRIIRITPTYAGKSFGALTPIIYPWNYPHVRGEELKRRYHFFLNPELPPRTRGRAEFELDGKPKLGITPTYAGKSLPDLVVYSRQIRKSDWNRVPNLRFAARNSRYASAPRVTSMSVPTPQI